MRKGSKTLLWSMVTLLVAGLAIGGCGSKKKSSSANATTFSVTVTESGKTAKYSAPSSVKGGLVKEVLVNHGKGPHGAQFVRLEGNHTPQEAIKFITSNSNKTPEWLRAEGGVGGAVPGKPDQAIVILPAGKYLVGDFNGQTKNPGYAQFTVSGSGGGSLPSTPTTVTAANPAKDKFKWEISGSLKTGPQTITFDSKGKEALHLIGAFKVKGNPSNAALVKALSQQNGNSPLIDAKAPPAFSSVLDGGKAEVTSFTLQQPGKYVLFCPFTDRDGGKEHFKEGLITQVTVK